MSRSPDVQALVPVARVFEQLGIQYYLSGSVASSMHGSYRATADIDIVAEIGPEHVDDLVRLLKEKFYIDANMIHSAIRSRSSFNLIHDDTSYKIDVFLLKPGAYDQAAWQRAEPRRPFKEHDGSYPVASPEDVILSKLAWYRAGDEVSAHQLRDVVGVMKVYAGKLDQEYLTRWAAVLEVSDLLERTLAIAEAEE